MTRCAKSGCAVIGHREVVYLVGMRIGDALEDCLVGRFGPGDALAELRQSLRGALGHAGIVGLKPDLRVLYKMSEA
jgi:hypothetical protein